MASIPGSADEKDSGSGLSISVTAPPILKGELSVVRDEVRINPQAKEVTLASKLAGRNYKPPVTIPFEEYVDSNLRIRPQFTWMGPGKSYVEAGTSAQRRGSIGITIPVSFPKAIANVIGQGTSLSVLGSRKISFSGRSEWTEGQLATATSRVSKFPSLNMQQQSRFTIEGKVGERISVQVDQDSDRLTDLENSIKIRYDGDEDQFVQEIEAGNTTLSLAGSQFVGYSSQHKGLFGIRTRGKIGGLDFTAIASQEKSSGAKKSFRGQAEESSHDIRDYQYLSNTYFFLDERYRQVWKGVNQYDPGDSIVVIRIYVDDNNMNNNLEEHALQGIAFYDLNAPDSVNTGQYERGFFHELDREEYFVDRRFGYIVLGNSIQDSYTLAVYYRNARGEVFGKDTYDPSNPNDQLSLKLVKARNHRPENPTWNLEWKDVYDLGARNINSEGLEVKIFKDVSGGQPQETQDGTPYLRIFGLDQHGRTLGSAPDNIIDLDQNIIDLGRGELIFPNLEPFNPVGDELKEKIPQIYNSNDDRTQREASKYFIRVNYKSRQTRFSLGQPVIEGTEVVTLNGKTLTRGKDYNINYFTGEVNFLTDEALNPSSSLNIDYEYAPLFMPQQKSLLGFRLEHKLNDRSTIGSSFLFSSEKSTESRIQVGREPGRNAIWDIDANLQFQPKLLTRIVNLLPLVKTEAPSSLNISGEFAQSLPNPNVKGKAFIDDFEGSKNTTSLGIVRVIWTRGSVPVGLDTTSYGRIIWYNPWDRVSVKDIYGPQKQTSVEESRTNILSIEFDPKGKGTQAWGGIMRALPAGGSDFSRARFIELMVKGDKGILDIDMGAISEDANPNGVLDTEDKLINGQRTGIITPAEDVGLFGGPDDEWNYENRYDYSHINGTRHNLQDPDQGPKPDTEDLNNNGFLDKKNDYFRYSLQLDKDDDFRVNGTEYNGWRLLRIPIWDSKVYSKQGKPDSTHIEFVRLWVTGTEEKVKIDIASIDVVGNDWLELGVNTRDSGYPVVIGEDVDVTVKDSQESRDYTPPPGVKAPIDLVTKVRAREQSLVFKLTNIGPKHEVKAYKVFFQKEDYTMYNSLKAFVHGDSLISRSDTSDIEFFIRFGADTTNYYEQRRKIYPGWDERNWVNIDIQKITSIKYDLLKARADSATTSNDTTKGDITVHGNPSLSNIKTIIMGIYNGADEAITGEVWVDELRLDDVRRTPGNAARLSIDASLADFMNIGVNVTRKTSEFRDIRGQAGSGSLATSLGFRSDLKLEKFFPNRWALSLPINFSYERSDQLPRLQPGSDIVLRPDQQEAQKSFRERKTAGFSFHRQSSSKNPFVNLTLDRFRLNLSYGGEKGSDPYKPYSQTTNYNGSFDYDLSPRGERNGIKLFKWFPLLPKSLSESKFFYKPSKVGISWKVNNNTSSYTTPGRSDTTKQETFLWTDDYRLGLNPFSSMDMDYGLVIKRDLRTNLNLNTENFRLGNETDRVQTTSFAFTPKLFNWLRQDFSFRADYHEDNDPQLRSIGGQTDTGRKVDVNNSSSAKITFGIAEILRKLSPVPKQSPPVSKVTKPGEDEALTDTTGTGKGVKKEETKVKKGFFFPLAMIGSLSDNLQAISGSYTRTTRMTTYGLMGRPSFQYQLGLSDRSKVPSVTPTKSLQRDVKTVSDHYDASTGLALPGNLSLRGKYEYDYSSSVSSSSSEDRKKINFPSVSAQWSGVEKFLFLKKIVQNSTVDFSFERENSTRGGPKLKDLLSQSSADKFSPFLAWTIRWRNGLGTTLRRNYSKSEEKDFREGKLNGVTNSASSSITASLTYTFSASRGVKLPLKGKINLKSDLDIGIDLSFSRDYQEYGIGNLPPVPRSDNSEWKFSQRANYQFSKKFTGGTKIEIGNRLDRRTNTTRKVREIGFWGEISFN